MAKRKPKQSTLSDQLREFILQDERTRYRLWKLSGVDAGQLSRFVRGKGRLGHNSFDALGQVPIDIEDDYSPRLAGRQGNIAFGVLSPPSTDLFGIRSGI